MTPPTPKAELQIECVHPRFSKGRKQGKRGRKAPRFRIRGEGHVVLDGTAAVEGVRCAKQKKYKYNCCFILLLRARSQVYQRRSLRRDSFILRPGLDGGGRRRLAACRDRARPTVESAASRAFRVADTRKSP